MTKIEEKIEVPFVLLKLKDGYHGFVPGIVKRDVIDDDYNRCVARLEINMESEIEKMKRGVLSIPFFPTDEQIYRDFDDVYAIIRKKM